MRIAAVPFLTALLPIVLLACAGPDSADYPAPPAATRAEAAVALARPVAVTFPAFGDDNPHPWDGRAPDAYAVHGIDVSRWQGPVDWPAVRSAGIAFAYIKATEGGDHADPRFPDNWQGAARAGVLVEPGDVHYLRPDPPTNRLRLGFAAIPLERIEPGLKLLAGIVREMKG